MQPTFPFLSERTKKQGVEFFFLRLLSYALTPNRSQREREFIFKLLPHWPDDHVRKLSSMLVLQFQVLTRTLESVDKFDDVVISLELVHPKVETIEIAIRRIVGIAL